MDPVASSQVLRRPPSSRRYTGSWPSSRNPNSAHMLRISFPQIGGLAWSVCWSKGGSIYPLQEPEVQNPQTTNPTHRHYRLRELNRIAPKSLAEGKQRKPNQLCTVVVWSSFRCEQPCQTYNTKRESLNFAGAPGRCLQEQKLGYDFQHGSFKHDGRTQT